MLAVNFARISFRSSSAVRPTEVPGSLTATWIVTDGRPHASGDDVDDGDDDDDDGHVVAGVVGGVGRAWIWTGFQGCVIFRQPHGMDCGILPGVRFRFSDQSGC